LGELATLVDVEEMNPAHQRMPAPPHTAIGLKRVRMMAKYTGAHLNFGTPSSA
jgi:hypothetical protein